METLIVNGKTETFEELGGKKINKTFSLSPHSVEFLESVDRKSAFINLLLEGYQQGRFIQPDTLELLKRYKTVSGVDAEEALHKILLKRIEKIERNMEALKDSAPEEVKNKIGGAFLKLNRAYDELVAENEGQEIKSAVTFGVLFKKSGCNHQSIRGWLRANKEKIDAYHQSLGITDPGLHNRQIGVLKRVARFKEEAGVGVGVGSRGTKDGLVDEEVGVTQVEHKNG